MVAIFRDALLVSTGFFGALALVAELQRRRDSVFLASLAGMTFLGVIVISVIH
jgi:FtsH-binding integral membrane protein